MNIEVTLMTGRTIKQGEALEVGKNSEAYTKAAAVCEMDPADMEKAGVKEGDVVQVSTQFGEVLVWAERSQQAPHQGMVFIPLGPWANSIVNPETDSVGMPSFKSINAKIKPAAGGKVLSAVELIRELYRNVH